MATKELKLSIVSRKRLGTTGAQSLRAEGKIPAVVYGHGATPTHVAVDARAFEDLLHRSGRNAIVTLSGDQGTKETVLVREVQLHSVSHRPLHADFQRVSADETVRTLLSVVTVGVAEGVKQLGGVMDVITHQLDVEGPASRIPEHLEIDVSELGLHGHVTAADVRLPAGFKMLTPPDTIVVSIEASRTERDVEQASVPGELAEPEVIGASPRAE